jgi:two-component system response regulator HydG
MADASPPELTQGPGARPRVLVVDDQLAMAETLAEGLSERGYDATPLASSREAAKVLFEDRFDALVTDLRMPEVDGLALLAISRKAAPHRPVIIMTAYGAVETAIESIRQGASHYLTKPFRVDELALFLRRALEEARAHREVKALRQTLKDRYALSRIIGSSPGMQEVCDLVERIADANIPVLITGETGTGKGLIAHAIHAHGGRASAPFVAINCAALPENLLESELFGHVKGAFTGATSNRAGLFEEANGGTLFLDEIGDMAAALQAKLLHVLENAAVRAVGSNKERHVDTRVIAATHRNLREAVASGAFRSDLLYRLDVVTIDLPPLRHRREDLPPLIDHFVTQARAKHTHSKVERFSSEALERLLQYDWPGNVRELEHVVERAVLLGRSNEVIVSELPVNLVAKPVLEPSFKGTVIPMRELQRRYAAWAYEQLGARKLLTAEKLGVDAKTLAKWLREEPDSTKPE